MERIKAKPLEDSVCGLAVQEVVTGIEEVTGIEVVTEVATEAAIEATEVDEIARDPAHHRAVTLAVEVRTTAAVAATDRRSADNCEKRLALKPRTRTIIVTTL